MQLLALAAWIAACGLAVSGAISFIGLVSSPNFMPIRLSPEHRLRMLTFATVLSTTFIIVAGFFAQMIFSPIVLLTGTVITRLDPHCSPSYCSPPISADTSR